MSETIRRVADHTKGFTIMVNEALQRPDLSARAKGLYAYLMTLPDDWVIQREEIPRHFTEGRDAIDKAFKELVKLGYITLDIERDERRFITKYAYTVHEKAIPEKDRTKALKPEKLVPEKPLTGSPVTENPLLLSTKEPSTNNQVPAATPSIRFQKPTVEEVRAYCKERKNSVNPELWLAHYEANGWKVGRSSMKDWKAAVRTWEHSNYGPPKKSSPPPNADPLANDPEWAEFRSRLNVR